MKMVLSGAFVVFSTLNSFHFSCQMSKGRAHPSVHHQPLRL